MEAVAHQDVPLLEIPEHAGTSSTSGSCQSRSLGKPTRRLEAHPIVQDRTGSRQGMNLGAKAFNLGLEQATQRLKILFISVLFVLAGPR